MSFVKSPLAVSENIQASEHLRTVLRRERKTRGREGERFFLLHFPLFSLHMRKMVFM